MLSRVKKNKIPLKPDLFIIRWFPNSRSCVKTHGQKVKPQQMPPLMVRKPEWRR